MKELKFIRDFYKPIQPTVNADNNEIIYREIQPEKTLENYIYCYWELKSRNELKLPFIYRVVSDGCIDIFFNHKILAENFAMGFSRKYTEFSIGTEFDYIGIRFLPAIFSILFGIDSKVLSDQSPELKQILPEFSDWIQTHLKVEHTLEDIARLLNTKFNELVRHQKFEPDIRFLNSLKLIFQNKGHLDTEKDLNTGLSPRQLRRIFNYYIGTTPKAFSNVVRFQHILNAKPSAQSLKQNKLYFDAGFFDQAHFIKHFKTFYGVTPAKAFH